MKHQYDQHNKSRAAAELNLIPAAPHRFVMELENFLTTQRDFPEQLADIDHRLKAWGEKLTKAMSSSQSQRAWLVYQRGLNKQRHKLLSETYQLRGATDPHVFEQWDLKYQRTTAINHATFSRFEYP